MSNSPQSHRDEPIAHDIRDIATPATDGSLDVVAHAERLLPSTTFVESGRVRVTKRVITEERTITVPVHREEIVVEHLDDPTSGTSPELVDNQLEAVKSHVAEQITLYRSEPRIEYDYVPVETVELIVDTRQGYVQVTEDVSHERVVVEKDGVEVLRTEGPDREVF